MTLAEVITHFKGVPLHFSHYYKYTFTFTGEKDSLRIAAWFGGGADDIYRSSVKADEPKLVEEDALEYWTGITVTNAKGETVFEHYDPY